MNKDIKDFIIPSIDLLNGKIVRLLKGDYNNPTFYDIKIEDLIEKYKSFKTLHIVNLNGAKSENCDKNIEIIKKIRKFFNGKIQIGGGIRDEQTINYFLNELKMDKVVLGTLCINEPEKTTQIIKTFGADKIVLAIDCKKDNYKYVPKTNGWLENGKYNDIFELLKLYNNIATNILITDISQDGTLMGTNTDLYKQIKMNFPNLQLQASGGIGCLDDVLKLNNISDYVIIGKAMYENNLLKNVEIYSQNNWKTEDFIKSINWEKCNNLVPIIVQDIKTFDVLMFGYANEEAIKLTQKTGRLHFFSRTKNRIWMKGETSNNFLNVVKLKLDCDNDTILALVNPIGNTCHTGSKTCFNERVNFLAELQEVIDSRLKNNDCENSYVASLSRKGINKVAQKVGEEATEVVISALNESDDRFLNESADLLFHFLLLLKNKNFELNDVVKVLEERHKERVK